jgi:ABC-type transport system substrate-binding protein
MTNRHTKNARVLRRIGAAVAATIAVSTVASSGSQAASNSSAVTRGGSVKVAIFDTLPGFCFSNNPANSALMTTRTMYEGLVEKTRGGDYIGLLATSWTKSADLKTWTFKLRQGVKFHDGSPFNADAAVLNYNFSTGRAFLAAVQAGVQGGLSVAAAQSAANTRFSYTLGTAAAFQSNIAAISKVDDNTITFKLDRAQNDFPGTLYASGRGFMRAPAQIADGTKCSANPIGTGPFKVESWNPSSITVVRNADYWRTDPTTKAKLPYLDKITFTNVKEGSQRAAAVRKGTYDAAMFSGGVEGTFIRDLRQRKSVVAEHKSPNEYFPSLFLNQTRTGSPFSSKNARLAVLTCIDRANFTKVRTRGESITARSLVGKNNPMFNTKGVQKFNVAESKKFVTAWQAEPGNAGKTLTFSMPADTSSASQANQNFLKKQWEKCGITVNIVVEETGTILTNTFNSRAAGGNQMAYDATIIVLFEGTDVAFNLPFVLSNAWPSTTKNPTANFRGTLGTLLGLNHHTDTKVDELFYAGQAATTKAAAKAKYAEGTAYLQANGFMTSIQEQYYTIFVSKKLQGVGKLQISKGKTQRISTNWGIDWTGVSKSK